MTLRSRHTDLAGAWARWSGLASVVEGLAGWHDGVLVVGDCDAEVPDSGVRVPIPPFDFPADADEFTDRDPLG
jgi:hypothetical protein